MKEYDPKSIEPKWQAEWERSGLYKAEGKKLFGGRPKWYSLMEFPYPSGDGLHTGHVRGFTAMDIVSRKRRMQGFDVMYPIGWDAFGLPTENFALKTKRQPADITRENTENFKKQFGKLGMSFDWSREINTTDPKYYKWTQWLFLKFLEKGLAYKAKMPINWCPKDKIGLANEEVVDGKCERCGTPVEQREKEQWMLKITAYADRLYDDLEQVDFPERVKAQQRNWIGKSEGAEINFPLVMGDKEKSNFVILHGYTGRADKNFIPWLRGELEARGHKVQSPQLPNTENPREDEQVSFVLDNCDFDEHTVVIGHSLGAVVAMKVLERLNKSISGLVLVATAIDPKFDTRDKDDSKIYRKNFSWDFNFDKVKKLTGEKIAILSDTKEGFRMGYLKYLSKMLSARLVEVESQREHFCADKEPEILKSVTPLIKIFTTRPDTIFGATFIAVSPKLAEEWVGTDFGIKADTDKESKEKLGADTGLKVINPATNKEIPVWVVNYVSSDYGTGAIMGVPAHDERDYEFAKKHDLPIKHVIAPHRIDHKNPHVPGKELVFRKAIMGLVRNPKNGKYLILKWKQQPWTTFVMGGIEGDEDPVEAARREIQEETGYKNLRLVRVLGGPTQADFYAAHKGVNRTALTQSILFELENEERNEVSAEESQIHEVTWMSPDEVRPEIMTHIESDIVLDRVNSGKDIYSGTGVLINSGEFDQMKSEEASRKMAEKFGKWVTKYKLRDWVFSRQRYWGEPIPVVHCAKCGIVPVPEKDLPVELPKVEKYEPTETGESPLANVSEWVNTACPKCGGAARRETDTMPNWAGSSWYFLRYVDPQNGKEFASKKLLKHWMPVDWYNGGMEHTTLHLLYSRFWNKFLFDIGLVPTSEPYKKRTSHGIILAADGRKMSKSFGNVVNPDDIVARLGADTLRLYEMFMGPFEQAIAWNDDSLVGPRRFLEKVWRLKDNVSDTGTGEFMLHSMIKKISDDIENLGFNTAVSSLMIYTNELESREGVSKVEYETLLRLLAPFAPHIAEELWHELGNNSSIHASEWPKYDESKLVKSEASMAVQVNGKVRGSISVSSSAANAEVEKMALEAPEIAKWLAGKEVQKVVVVPQKIVNIVVK